MAVDWDYYGKKAYQAIKDNGMSATVTFQTTDGTYDVTTGKDATVETESYDTDALLKNYSAEMKQVVNPEDVEITFHSGTLPDTIPDLLDKENIQIKTDNKIYEVLSIEAIRPAGITMLYKARSKEYGEY